MLLKIAPDLGEIELDAIAEVALASGIDGLICTNTTIDRASVDHTSIDLARLAVCLGEA